MFRHEHHEPCEACHRMNLRHLETLRREAELTTTLREVIAWHAGLGTGGRPAAARTAALELLARHVKERASS